MAEVIARRVHLTGGGGNGFVLNFLVVGMGTALTVLSADYTQEIGSIRPLLVDRGGQISVEFAARFYTSDHGHISEAFVDLHRAQQWVAQLCAERLVGERPNERPPTPTRFTTGERIEVTERASVWYGLTGFVLDHTFPGRVHVQFRDHSPVDIPAAFLRRLPLGEGG